jgi:hypothetical protein
VPAGVIWKHLFDGFAATHDSGKQRGERFRQRTDMSRSNPTETSSSPCTRWFEWAGGSDGGVVRYYDKEAAATVNVGDKFAFLLLDELAAVKGWHDASDSGIYSNEVRDTRQDVLVVKSFKGGELASGLYAQIRDRIGNFGGHFHASCYIAYKDGDQYKLGNIGFKGAALNAWVEFKKQAGRKDGRPAYYVGAVRINGYEEGTKGRVVYRVPKFTLAAVSEDANERAIALDKDLQAFLSDYLKRARVDQAETIKTAAMPARDVEAELAEANASSRGGGSGFDDLADDLIPF